MWTLEARLAWIVSALRTAIGVFAARQARAHQVVWIGTRAFAPRIEPGQPKEIPAEIWLLLSNRLGRLNTRFQSLLERWRAGALPAPRPSRRRPARAASTNTTPRLPRAFGWVNHRIPDSAPPSGHLEQVLHDPETEQFVTAAPQAGRLLRPLCHALGQVQPAWLRLPPRPRTPRPKPEPKPRWPKGERRPITHPYPMLPDDQPLRDYVRRAAKAWKKTGG